MRVPPDDYVMPETIMEVMQDHMKKYNYKVNIFSGFVDPVRFGITLRIAPKHKIAYIGCRERLHEKCINYIVEKHNRRYRWQYFIIMNDGIFVFDPKTMLWGEFVEQVDQMMTGERPEHECCICFDKTNLIKCPQCTTRYCKTCIAGKSMDCFVCSASISHDPKSNRVLVQYSNKVSMRMGCLFKILHIKFGMNTIHMIRDCQAEDLANLLVKLSTKDEYGTYFDAKRFWATVTAFVQHVGVSDEVIAAAIDTEIPDDVMDALNKMRI